MSFVAVASRMCNGEKTYPERPTPLIELVDKAADYRTDLGAYKWTGCIYHHRRRELVPRKHVSYGAASNAQECTSCETVDETLR